MALSATREQLERLGWYDDVKPPHDHAQQERLATLATADEVSAAATDLRLGGQDVTRARVSFVLHALAHPDQAAALARAERLATRNRDVWGEAERHALAFTAGKKWPWDCCLAFHRAHGEAVVGSDLQAGPPTGEGTQGGVFARAWQDVCRGVDGAALLAAIDADGATAAVLQHADEPDDVREGGALEHEGRAMAACVALSMLGVESDVARACVENAAQRAATARRRAAGGCECRRICEPSRCPQPVGPRNIAEPFAVIPERLRGVTAFQLLQACKWRFQIDAAMGAQLDASRRRCDPVPEGGRLSVRTSCDILLGARLRAQGWPGRSASDAYFLLNELCASEYELLGERRVREEAVLEPAAFANVPPGSPGSDALGTALRRWNARASGDDEGVATVGAQITMLMEMTRDLGVTPQVVNLSGRVQEQEPGPWDLEQWDWFAPSAVQARRARAMEIMRREQEEREERERRAREGRPMAMGFDAEEGI